jgi:hypothetical protein
MTPVRTLAALLSLVAVLGLTACGQAAQEEGQFQSENAQVAETEGIYIHLDELKYQVQVSRQLNPLIRADAAYFDGLSRSDRDLASDEVWFGVWMRVENDAEEPIPSAEEFVIHDTQDNVYRPVELAPTNVWAYRPAVVQPDELYPFSNTPADERQPNGALLLFKVRNFSLDNRPLELVITARESGAEAIVNLDV